MTFPNNQPVIFYDGNCRLCLHVAMVVQHSSTLIDLRPIAFPPSSDTVSPGCEPTGSDCCDGVEYFENGRHYHKSSALLRIAWRLGLPWSLLGSLLLFPRSWRDFFYDIVAKNRYLWFGQVSVDRPSARLLEPEDTMNRGGEDFAGSMDID